MPNPPRVADVFDALAPTYDQTGMPFFRPVGARLVELVAPRPGERALDIGCGRGAVTVPLAGAVGADGSVLAVDVSPNMVAATQALVRRRRRSARSRWRSPTPRTSAPVDRSTR